MVLVPTHQGRSPLGIKHNIETKEASKKHSYAQIEYSMHADGSESPSPIIDNYESQWGVII